MARFSLMLDKADDALIDEGLRNGAVLRGSTSWVLMMAILIASIGLNINSTAVIIGAMLVSPLMGPIMGIGYGVGIYDFELVKKSLNNLGVAVGISLATSTLYFYLSPLTGEQSELLARTSPTIWDVQIALFGGLAGIIGVTRKEKTNVIPGVAIATALMPPLCTAGYGLAGGKWQYFFGAFYLFAINSVFIAIAAVVVVRVLGLPHKSYVDKKVERHVKHALLVVALVTALPSVYLASRLVSQELFSSQARAFVARSFKFPDTHVLEISVEPKDRRVTVTLMGEIVPQTTLQDIRAGLAEAGLAGATLSVYQTPESQLLAVQAQDSSKAALLSIRQTLEERGRIIEELRRHLGQASPWMASAQDIAREAEAQWPELEGIVIGQGRPEQADDGQEAANTALLSAVSSARLSARDRQRMEAWLLARTKADAVRLLIEQRPGKTAPPARALAKAARRN